MRSFFAVVKFELNNYFKSKGYIISTIIIALIFIVGLSIPSFIHIDGLSSEEENPVTENEHSEGSKEEYTEEPMEEPKEKILIYDQAGIIKDIKVIADMQPFYEWSQISSEEELKKQVKDETVEAGFVVKSPTSFSCIVLNSSMSDTKELMFQSLLERMYQESYMKEHNINIAEMNQILNTRIESEYVVLGKDSVMSYGYTYALVFILYMMIILYGQIIAMSVTSEKSNRAIEVLVTSTTSNNLIFGKVIAGAIASLLQVFLIVGGGLISYQMNKKAWNNMLDSILEIPAEVLLTFAFFGLLGFLFYCFCYGALGALVSKTEDVGKSCGGVTYIFLIVFFISMFSLSAPNSMLAKVASFIPFSSPNLMLIRVAMGKVSSIEIIISFLLLLTSTVAVGVLGAKIYRFGTLHYGNPLKLRNVLKSLKKKQ